MSNKKSVEPISQDFFAWVTPEGDIQLGTLSPSIQVLLAMTKLLSSAGVQSADELLKKGFRIHRLKTNIENLGPVDDPLVIEAVNV